MRADPDPSGVRPRVRAAAQPDDLDRPDAAVGDVDRPASADAPLGGAVRGSSSHPDGASAPGPGAEPAAEPPGPPTGALVDPPVPARAHGTRRWVARVVATLLVAALAAAGAGVVREREARAAEAHTLATATLHDAVTHLRAARDDGRTVLAASAGRVADNPVRARLAAVLVDLPATEPDPDLPRAEATAWCLAQAEVATDRAARIAEATLDVRRARETWERERARTAHADAVRALADAVGSARAVLAGSEGRVLDDAVREALAAAVAAADDVLGAPGPVGTAALDAAAVTVRAHTDALVVATTDVVAAEEAWQVEQDRLATQRAAAAGARSPSPTGARGAGTAGGGSSSGARTGGGSAGGPASGSGPASGTGAGRYDGWLSGWSPGDPVPDGWTVVVETEGGGWGGDEHGDVWDLG